MTPAIAYLPQSGWTACGAPFAIVTELPLIGPVLIISLMLCGAALCFLADRAARRVRLGTPPRGGIRVLPRPGALPQRA
jgi:hypothetical protein